MKKLILFLLVVAMIFTLAACKPKAPTEDKNGTGNENPAGDNIIVDPNPEGEVVTIKLYFANQEYIMTGDSNLDQIIAIEREVKVKEKPIEEVILEELRNKPEDKGLATIAERIKVLSVETAEGTAYVNLSGENLHGGSLEESLLLQQIVFSLTELEKIDRVQFLVDGSKRETLMGHILIEEPLKRPDIK
ncbi:MAG: GerMN domain-containing protein [Natronincolaceae bacterium]|nr:GerMN domain-containing protein [Bacillota bacterium]NLK91383.1 hypothetical protein [Clostridiales bacterium]